MNLKIFTSIIVVLFSCFTLIGQKTSQNINDFELFLPLEVGWKFDDGFNYQIKLINKAKKPPRFLVFHDIISDVVSNNAKIYTDYPFNDETGIHYFMYKDTTTKEFTLDSLVGYHLMLNVDWDSLNNKFRLKILGVAPTFTNNGVYEKMFWIKNNADSIGSGNTDFIWNNDAHIICYELNGNLVFLVDLCLNCCNGYKVYDCEENLICTFDQVNNTGCTNFQNSAINEIEVWKNY